MKSKLSGVITALVTPFKDGAVDKKSFVRLLRRQLDQGVNGFVINGTTGESPALNWNEVKELYQLAKSEVAGQVPLVVGTGANSTARTCELSREAGQWQPEALLVVVPYYNRPPQRGLIEHFRQVARAATVPILLYNVPSRTVANLEPASVAELSREDGIIGLKDATGDMAVMGKIKTSVPEDFLLFSGDDGTCVDYAARGGHGVISVSSHVIPAEMKAYLQKAQDGKAAAEFKSKYADLMRLLFVEANPIPVKAAVHWMGLIDSPEMRLPLTVLDEKYHAEFKACLKSLSKLN